jgi:hypothetical protein
MKIGRPAQGFWFVRLDNMGAPKDYGEVLTAQQGSFEVQLYNSVGDFIGRPRFWSHADFGECAFYATEREAIAARSKSK